MKKKYLHTRIDLVISPQRLYIYIYKITSWNFFYVYDIMLYTCTRVEYTCSIDVKDTAAYNSAYQKIE